MIKIPIKSDNIRIGCFDMGKVNYGVYVEQFKLSTLKKMREIYRKLPKNKQRRVKGRMNKIVSSILNVIFKNGKRIFHDVKDLRADKKSKILDIPTRKNIISYLDSKRYLFASCDIIIIEKQFFNRKMANVDAIKEQEITMTWFLINFPNKLITDFNASFKTYVLGGGKMTKTQRKKWTIAKAKSIYEMRKDFDGLKDLESRKNAKGKTQKKDDVSDAVCMAQAYKYLIFIADY